ncbi:MAG: hypothetical protein HRT74_11535 [Flavobacteriales bacterium]|nr:hypothetical protein [Flavobacteriales bacterium]
MNVPDQLKYPTTPKQFLIRSLGDLLPDEIVNRPKMGFTLPWEIWMKEDLKSFCEDKITALSRREYFNQKGVLKLWKMFLNSHPMAKWSRVWPLVVLENWLQENNVE